MRVSLFVSGIKNFNKPICINCFYFSKNKNVVNTFYNNNISTNELLGFCTKFGYKNVVTGEITYEYAEKCRRLDGKCGEDGKFFNVNVNKEIIDSKTKL